jgi:hypothetical protein
MRHRTDPAFSGQIAASSSARLVRVLPSAVGRVFDAPPLLTTPFEWAALHVLLWACVGLWWFLTPAVSAVATLVTAR